MMEYTKDYWKDVAKGLEGFGSAHSRYSIEVDGEFRRPPVHEIVSFLENPANTELQDRNAKQCIIGRTVKIKLDGEVVGSGIQFASPEDPWDLWPTLADHPMALIALREVAAAFVLKKSLPPPSKDQGEAGARATR